MLESEETTAMCFGFLWTYDQKWGFSSKVVKREERKRRQDEKTFSGASILRYILCLAANIDLLM